MEMMMLGSNIMVLLSPFRLVAWAIQVLPKAVHIFSGTDFGLMLVFSCSIPLFAC